MVDYIVIAVLAVVILVGVRTSIKHFRGESGCSGGGTYKARPKKLSKVVEKKTFRVEGMSCQHCVNRVMEAVNGIDGVSGAVNLKKGVAVISKAYPVKDEVIRTAIEKAGYQVTEIR